MFAPRETAEYVLESERRVIRVRRHWASLLGDLFEAIALIAASMIISPLLSNMLEANDLSAINTIAQNLIWYASLVILLRLAYFVVEWWVERLVVTDKRFMISSGVFAVKVAMMPIGKVTDLTYERSVWGRMLGYGTLVVESAGQIQALNRIEYLPTPQVVYDAISELTFGDKKAQAARFSMLNAKRAVLGEKPSKWTNKRVKS